MKLNPLKGSKSIAPDVIQTLSPVSISERSFPKIFNPTAGVY
jgi:hypothetical protein